MIYKGYKIEDSQYFSGIFRVVKPSGKFLTLTTKLEYAKLAINLDIEQLLKGA
jgi:hypothetical protein